MRIIRLWWTDVEAQIMVVFPSFFASQHLLQGWEDQSRGTHVHYFFFLMFIYLAALGLGCSIWDLHCVMQDVSLQCSGSLIVVSGLRACRLSWGTWLSCSMACRILVPWPGIEPASSALHSGFLTTGPPEKSHMYTIHGALEGELELNRVKYLA